MTSPRRRGTDESKTRTALLDAAERLMTAEGYAAVSSRRVANEAGVNNALVYYYFGTMTELFLAVYRRRAEWMLARQAEALAGDQPLWALWDLTRDQANTALNLEFIALGNHAPEIRAEVAAYSRRYRRLQLARLGEVLPGYGVDPERWPPAAVLIWISSVSRFLLMEEAYDLDIGHAETVAAVERQLGEWEGERRPRRRAAPAS